jgi:hypothetical protein
MRNRSTLAAGAAQHALVADAPRQPVRVVAFQQELGVLARDSERVAERGNRDRGERSDRLDAAFVELQRHCDTVAKPLQAPLGLQEGGQVAVLDLHGSGLRQLAFERRRGFGPVAQGGRAAGQERLAAAPLDVEEAEDVRRPRLGRKELAEREAWVER